MNLLLQKSVIKSGKTLVVSGSKSETNRLLLLQALYPELCIENGSVSDDSLYMKKALQEPGNVIDIHHAGTAMRFLTAYFAIQQGREVILTGSDRMKERPITVLVDALRHLGADIAYKNEEGFPPLKIKGKQLEKNQVKIQADISSQYISALLLIGSKMPDGLLIEWDGELTSRPYVEMTVQLLQKTGISVFWQNNSIRINFRERMTPITVKVESDWSSASYHYTLIALSAVNTKITLGTFKKNSLQGDARLVEWYRNFGVETIFNNDESITLIKKNNEIQHNLSFDLKDNPDLAQTIAVTAFGLQKNILLSGLHTLKIKETDRLLAMKNELGKFGAQVTITSDSLQVNFTGKQITELPVVKTYQDHRMAMAFAVLALKYDLFIEEAEVVSKSYPGFWEHLTKLGIQISKTKAS